MGGFSVAHWVIVGVILLSATVPPWMIAKRAGFPGFFGLVVLVPLLGLVALWAFAFARWPALNREN